MKFKSNLHSHTNYCDGKGEVKDYIIAAIDKGFQSYGISTHNPISDDVKWAMKEADFESYLNDIEDSKTEFGKEIEIYKGLEVDYFDDIEKPLQWLNKLDYWIGSVHFIDRDTEGKRWEIDGSTELFKKGLQSIHNGDIQKVIHRFYDLSISMIKKWNPPIIGHLDKIKIHNSKEFFFDDTEDWYLNKVAEVLDIAKNHESIIEVNTRGMYKGICAEPYPSYDILEMIKDRDISIMLNSDSHHTREIDGAFDSIIPKLQEMGFDKLMVLVNGDFQAVEI